MNSNTGGGADLDGRDDDALSVPAADGRGFGLRRDRERRHGERRATERGVLDRRRSVRRHATFRSILFTLLALSVPSLKHRPIALRSIVSLIADARADGGD